LSRSRPPNAFPVFFLNHIPLPLGLLWGVVGVLFSVFEGFCFSPQEHFFFLIFLPDLSRQSANCWILNRVLFPHSHETTLRPSGPVVQLVTFFIFPPPSEVSSMSSFSIYGFCSPFPFPISGTPPTLFLARLSLEGPLPIAGVFLLPDFLFFRVQSFSGTAWPCPVPSYQ